MVACIKRESASLGGLYMGPSNRIRNKLYFFKVSMKAMYVSSWKRLYL